MNLFPRVAVPLMIEDPKREGGRKGYNFMDWGDSFRTGVKSILSG